PRTVAWIAEGVFNDAVRRFGEHGLNGVDPVAALGPLAAYTLELMAFLEQHRGETVNEESAQHAADQMRDLAERGLRAAGARRGGGRPGGPAETTAVDAPELVQEFHGLRTRLGTVLRGLGTGDTANRLVDEITRVDTGRSVAPADSQHPLRVPVEISWPASWADLPRDPIRALVDRHRGPRDRVTLDPLIYALLALPRHTTADAIRNP